MHKTASKVLKTWCFSHSAFWSTCQWGGYSTPRPPPLGYATGYGRLGARAAKGGLRGYIVPGPGPRWAGVKGPGRVQVASSSFGIFFYEVLFFSYSSPNFGQKIRLNFSGDFFFALHLILGKKSD